MLTATKIFLKNTNLAYIDIYNGSEWGQFANIITLFQYCSHKKKYMYNFSVKIY